MSNINKQALNQEKIEWLNKLADMEYCKSNPGHWLMSLKDTNMLAKLALRSVALLDELEAAEKRIAEQREYYESVIADGSMRIASLDARTLTVKLPQRATAGKYVDEEFNNSDLAAIYNSCRLECEVKFKDACAAAGIKLQIEGE